MIILDKSADLRKANTIVIPDAADFTPSGDFTLELFKLKFASNATAVLYSHYNATGNQRSLLVQFVTASSLQIVMSSDGSTGTTTTITYTWSPTNGVEYDVAFDRSGSAVRIYVDGTMVQSGTKAGALHNTTANLVIGADNALGNVFGGSCKAVRFTNGVARYATNGSYTVPTLPLPTS